MKDNTSKWLTGCGIGCVVLLGLMLIAGFVGYLALRPAIDKLGALQERFERLDMGRDHWSEFRPSANGRIAADRLEAFLDARARTVPEVDSLQRIADDLENRVHELEKGGSSPWEIGRTVVSGLGLIPKFADYQASHLEALAAAGMKPGEYLYLYTISYYAWLGKPANDGPPFISFEKNQSESRSRWPGDEESEADAEERLLHIVREVRLLHLSILKGTLAEAQLHPEAWDPSWVEAMQNEQHELKTHPGRLPWSDGLPEPISTSLEPFRDRLEQSYSPFANALEMITFKH